MAKKARLDRIKFEKSFDQKDRNSSSFINQVNKTVNCFECGETLFPSDKFCPNCGDSTKEEHFQPV